MHKIKEVVAAVAFASALAFTGEASANTIVDGSFESPLVTSNWYQNFSGTVGAWTVTTNNVDIVNTTVSGSPWTATAYDGVQFLDLVGFDSTGGISQTFTTIPGVTYNVSFAYGNNPGGTGFDSATVTVAGLSNLFSANFSTTSNIGWLIFTGSFVADATTATLKFDEVVGGNNGGVLLDAINVVATPLPATLPLFATGLGALGLLGWRRKRKPSAAIAA